jgi:hypothetical protein
MAASDVEIGLIIAKREKETVYHKSDEVAGSCNGGRVCPLLTQFHRNHPFSDTR